MRKPKQPITFIFLASLIEPMTGPLTTPCWIVQRYATDKHGYIRLKWSKKRLFAHRIMYELVFGKIPKGLVVRHTCDRPACINPCHLDAGTPAHNVADRVMRGRNGRNGNAKLTEQQVLQILTLLKEGELSQKKLAERFGIGRSTIAGISRGETWKYLQPRF